MKVGDLISYRGAPHIVIEFKQSVPVARPDLVELVLLDTTQLETRSVPIKWIRNSK